MMYPIRRVRLFFATFLMCLLCLNFVTYIDVEASFSSKTIRVGFPIQESLTMRDEKGKLSGYTYDYLMEISQYTGWNYEFVFVEGDINTQLLTFMSMLEQGEIDILGSMYYSDDLSSQYSYAGYSYGINYMGLFVSENSKLRESSLYDIDMLKVAVYNRSLKENPVLNQFAQMNNLNIEQVPLDNLDAPFDLLSFGQVDAILSTDLAMAGTKNMYPIVHFSPTPFYFATTKGNTDVVQILDYALSTIDKVNPNFMSELYNQYFSPSPDKIVFSKSEKQFIAAAKPLDVVVYNNNPPFQYIDKKTKKLSGISIEVLDYIAKTSGLSFNYHLVSTYEEYMDYINSGRAQIAGNSLNNYQIALDMNTALTLPWLNSALSIVIREGEILDPDGKIAVALSYKNIIPQSDNLVYYDSIKQCMDAVQDGAVNHSYIGAFSSQYYLNSHGYDNLKVVHQNEIPMQKISFGISNSSDIDLISIFNKCISAMPDETLNEISYSNVYKTPDFELSKFVKTNKIPIFAFTITFAFVIFLAFFYFKNQNQRRIAFENKRYKALSAMSNEYFYEYNILTDELSLSQKLTASFECEEEISDFSKKFAQSDKKEPKGIMQLGEYILHPKDQGQEISCLISDNSRRWFKLISTNISDKNKQIYTVGKIVDIHDAKTKQIRLEQKAFKDGLTGIYNITAFKNLIQENLESHNMIDSCALLIIDLDDFKNINDTFGHYTGDSILVHTANLITETFATSLIGRLGGDEFVVFAQNITQEDLTNKCQNLIELIQQKTHSLLGIKHSISIGIAQTQNNISYQELYKKADIALYKSKSMGKNMYTFFESIKTPK